MIAIVRVFMSTLRHISQRQTQEQNIAENYDQEKSINRQFPKQNYRACV